MLERVGHQGLQRLVHVALSPERPGKGVANLGAATDVMEMMQRAVADEDAVAAALDGHRQAAARLVIRLHLLEERFRLRHFGHRRPAPVTHHLRMGEHSEQRRRVGLHELSQVDALRRQRQVSRCNHRGRLAA